MRTSPATIHLMRRIGKSVRLPKSLVLLPQSLETANNRTKDDPEIWKDMPVCIQVAGRPYTDEALIAMSELVDEVVNGRT